MTGAAPANLSRLLRTPDPHGHARVTFVELFFDLVFVFAITQISHFLLHHFTPIGLAETAFLALAIWSVWIYTSWTTNSLDPQATPVRVLLFVLMLAGLVVSASIPEAFGEKGLAFGIAYAFMQVVRTLFMMLCLRGQNPANYRNLQRILVWTIVSGALWIAGGFVEHELRWLLWGAALLCEGLSPAIAFWVPGLGRSSTTDWTIDPHHFAERCALFVIIALGESLLVTGAKFAELDWTWLTFAAFAVAFIGSVAMWWVYFSMAAEEASAEFSRAKDPGRVARIAYTYFHIPLVAGIILAAVSDALILSHPLARLDLLDAAAVIGGPAIFLLGNLLFKNVLFEEFLRSHVAGLAILFAMLAVFPLLPGIVMAAAAAAVLIFVGVWENYYAAAWKKRNATWRKGYNR